MTPFLLLALAGPPADAPKPVAATREASKDQLEAHKKATPRLPLPPVTDGPFAKVNNGRYRNFYLPPGLVMAHGIGGREKDPAETLDPTFKVKLFWVASRANNCLYCLGHQEHKLLAAGVPEDGIAALDVGWELLPPAERAAVAFARRLTVEPHTVTEADVLTLAKHYTPTQVLEIVVAVAGFNSMNRWTDGLNIPADENGDFFKKGTDHDLSTFRTPTAETFRGKRSLVAVVGSDTLGPPAWPARPALEDRSAVEAAWAASRGRKPTLPLADGPGANWVRLLTTFPTSGAGRVAGQQAAAETGELPPRVKAEIAWAAARTDRAWYALDLARTRLKAVGLSDDQVFALDAGDGLPEADRAVVAFARKLTAAPATVTDADVAGLRKLFPDKQVAEIVHQVCAAAFLNRVTEVARLPLDQ